MKNGCSTILWLVGNVVGPEGQLAILTAYAIDMYDGDLLELTNTVRAIAAKFDRPGFRILVTGPPVIASTLNDMVVRDMSILGTWSLVVIVLALVFLFDKLWGFENHRGGRDFSRGHF